MENSDATTPLPQPLPALSVERLLRTLDTMGIRYLCDQDGSITAGWAEGILAFFRMGERGDVLQVRGYWMPDLTMAERGHALEVCNAYAIEQVFPKCYVMTGDDGHVQVLGEHSINVQHGLTDEQLRVQLETAVATIIAFFEHLNRAFPGQWSQSQRDG